MDNKHTRGHRLPFIADAAHKGNDLVIFDAAGAPFAGVNSYDVAVGDEGVADLFGVFSLPKTATGTAIPQGEAIYASGTDGVITVTTGDGAAYIGRAYGPSASGAANVLVNINFGPVPAA